MQTRCSRRQPALTIRRVALIPAIRNAHARHKHLQCSSKMSEGQSMTAWAARMLATDTQWYSCSSSRLAEVATALEKRCKKLKMIFFWIKQGAEMRVKCSCIHLILVSVLFPCRAKCLLHVELTLWNQREHSWIAGRLCDDAPACIKQISRKSKCHKYVAYATHLRVSQRHAYNNAH